MTPYPLAQTSVCAEQESSWRMN